MCNDAWEMMSACSLLPAPHHLTRTGIHNQALRRCCSNIHGRAVIYFLFLLSRCWHLVTSQSNMTSSLLSSLWTFPPCFGPSFGWGMSRPATGTAATGMHSFNLPIKITSIEWQGLMRSVQNKWALWVTR